MSVSEDLARRFISVELDPRTEDPEARAFSGDIRLQVTKERESLLAALLTIWRWGRIASDIKRGLALGSFDQWCQWVRDPFLALGCHDPAARVREAKQRDSRRQIVADMFAIWWASHNDQPVTVRGVHDDVTRAMDPQGRGRQFLAAQLEKLAGTRAGGFVLSRQASAGRWGAATYALKKTNETEEHRGHKDHGGSEKTGIQYATDAPHAPDAGNGMGENDVPSTQGGSDISKINEKPGAHVVGVAGAVITGGENDRITAEPGAGTFLETTP